MTSQNELCFVTWNTCGIKSTNKFPKKLADVLEFLRTVDAKIAFIQETHVGPDNHLLEETEDWKVYFTVYKKNSKGVAILIKKDDDIQFKYLCHEEDHSGGYIVLFCRLYGELFTLVNVYKHSKDRSVLYQLRDYLQDTAKGVLVVGGDFNTALDPYFDRNSTAVRTESPLHRRILEDFTASLNLRDTWAHLHPTETGYTCTRKQKVKRSRSRIDMFFMPENTIGMRVSSCEIRNHKISDHDPLVLKLKVQPLEQIPAVPPMLEDQTILPDRSSDKIRGTEILNAIKSLTDSGVQWPDNQTVDYYKQHRDPLTMTLKGRYNTILKDKCVPPSFLKHSSFENNCILNVEHLIFSQILANRLKVFITPSFRSQKKENMDLKLIITFARPEKIKFFFLKNRIDLEQKKLSSPTDFSILESLLPEESNSEDLRLLQQGCPLTNPILTLALNELRDRIIKSDIIVSICSFRQALFIQTERNKRETVDKVRKQFSRESGIQLEMVDYDNA